MKSLIQSPSVQREPSAQVQKYQPVSIHQDVSDNTLLEETQMMELAVFLSQLGEIKAQDDTDLSCLWVQSSWSMHLEKNACCFCLHP